MQIQGSWNFSLPFSPARRATHLWIAFNPDSKTRVDAFGRFERANDATFVGFVGMQSAPEVLPFSPCVEIGWRLAQPYWRKGYATEAAVAVADYAFATLGLSELVSFTAATNVRSRRVMKRLGMTHDSREDFDHPFVDAESPLRHHVLYRLLRPETVARSLSSAKN